MPIISSGVCRPRNLSADAKGSIHDDATATELGFRAGTVAGDIHLEQFGGILVRAFGQDWFERGSLSMYFMHATADLEPVEAVLDVPGSVVPTTNMQVTARMTTPEGITVAEGTASGGVSTEPTALHSRDRRGVDPSTLRMLRNMHNVARTFLPVGSRPSSAGAAAPPRFAAWPWCRSTKASCICTTGLASRRWRSSNPNLASSPASHTCNRCGLRWLRHRHA